MAERGLFDKSAWLTLLDVCAVAGDMDRTLQVFEEMKAEDCCDEVAYNRVVKAYCNADKVALAEQVVSRMEQDGFPPSSVTYNFLLAKHTGDAAYSRAWNVVKTMQKKGIEEDWFTVLTLVKAMKTCRDETYTRHVLEMLDTTTVDLLRDDIYFNTFLDAVMRTKDACRLERLVEQTLQRKFVPSLATMNMMIKAFSSLKRIDEATALWKEMTEVRAVEPNMISLGCIADALVVNDRLDDALRRMEAAGFQADYSIYNVLIEAAAMRQRFEIADSAFEQMLESGIPPSSYTLMILIKRHGREGNVERAGNLLRTLPEKYGFKVGTNVYSCYITVCT